MLNSVLQAGQVPFDKFKTKRDEQNSKANLILTIKATKLPIQRLVPIRLMVDNKLTFQNTLEPSLGFTTYFDKLNTAIILKFNA